MLRYNIAKLVRRPKGTVIELPAVDVRLSSEKEYYAALRLMLTQIAAMTRESIIPLYQSEQQQKRTARAFTGDADRSWFANLQALINQLQRVASDTVGRILDLEAKRHTDSFMATAKRALGIDLKAVVSQEDLVEYMQAAVARNTSLIQSLGDDLLKGIEQSVYANSIAGNSVTTLRKDLQKKFGLSDNRAKLIARDQTSKFNGDLNRIRQQQAGVDEYGFTTAHDEKVRKTHEAMEGRNCKWADASVYRADDGSWVSRSGIGGVQKHPGDDYQCRCVGRGLVRF